VVSCFLDAAQFLDTLAKCNTPPGALCNANERARGRGAVEAWGQVPNAVLMQS